MVKTINTYDIIISKLNYKQAKALKQLLKGIPAKINIRSKETFEIKYSCYLSKFDK
jgi:hypothetical protein